MNEPATTGHSSPQSVLLSIRTKFTYLSFREKALVLLFVLAGLFFWLDSHLTRFSIVGEEIVDANGTAKLNRQTLDTRVQSDEAFEAAIAKINLSALPSVDQVMGSIESLARNYADSYRGPDAVGSEIGTPLTFHTFKLNFNNAEYNKVIRFTEEVQESLPYVSLQRVSIRRIAARRTASQLNVSFEFRSIEYTP